MKLQYKKTTSGIGQTIERNSVHDCQAISVLSVPIPKGIIGELTTRTDATSGVLTMTSGHNIQTGEIFDIFWDGGYTYQAVADAVHGTLVTFHSAFGTLPVVNTAVVSSPRTKIRFCMNFNALSILSAQMTFADASVEDTVLSLMTAVGMEGSTTADEALVSGNTQKFELYANDLRVWESDDIDGEFDSVFADVYGYTIGYLYVSNGSPDADAVLNMEMGYDDATFDVGS